MKDYKAIWNNLSTTFGDASFYVCCIGDEDEIRRNGKLTAEFLQSVLQIEPTDKVFEIGCGVARIGRELAPYCAEWHGGDISGNMITYARERTADIPNIFLHELPDNSLSIFPDNTFDCVYSSIVFMHIDKLDVFTYIAEALRVLKPGGRAYFDTYNISSPEAWQEFLKTWQAYPYGQRPGHVSQFSSATEMRQFLEKAGFDQVHVDDSNPQLVVALGRKSAEEGHYDSSTVLETLHKWLAAGPAQLAAGPATGPAPEAAANTEPQATHSRYVELQQQVEAKNRYIAQLESAVEIKNRHIGKLERRIQQQQRILDRIPMRVVRRLFPTRSR